MKRSFIFSFISTAILFFTFSHSALGANLTNIIVSESTYTADAHTAVFTLVYTYTTAGVEALEGFALEIVGVTDPEFTYNSLPFGPASEEPGLDTRSATFTVTGLEPDSVYSYKVLASGIEMDAYWSDSFKTGVSDGEYISGDAVPKVGTPTEDAYYLLAPLPLTGIQMDAEGNQFINIGSTDGPTGANFDFGDYVNGLLTFAIGIAGALAVVMIVVGGVQYMSTDNFGEKAQGKEHIKNSLGGLILLIGSYMILNTLNPDLVNFNFQVAGVSVDAEGVLTLSNEEYSTITGVSKPLPEEIDAAVVAAAAANGLEYCQVKAIVEKESRGDAGAIGHDENVSTAPAYTAYKNSGKTFKNVAFTGAPPKNDDTVVCGEGGLCLDWRFSHGIGLMQLTYFTNGASPASYKLEDKTFNKPPKDLLILETNVSAGAKFLATLITSCGGNLQKAYGAYNSGSCEVSANGYAEDVMGKYNACKG